MTTINPTRTPTCLSAYRVSQLAAGLLAGPSLATCEAHLATCARCSELVAHERRAVEEALAAPVPPSLAVIAGRRDAAIAARKRWWRVLPMLGIVAMAALALVVVQTSGVPDPQLDTIRAKGAFVVEASVQRDNALVVDQQRLSDLGTLRDGDRLRLHLRNATGSVKVEGQDGATWVTLFEGPVPADGWLPLGLAVDNTSETALRVTVCAAAEVACETLTQRLDVR